MTFAGYELRRMTRSLLLTPPDFFAASPRSQVAGR